MKSRWLAWKKNKGKRTYVISDIHGCLDEFISLLDQIEWKEGDKLYLLGDYVDRGEKPVDLVLKISNMRNVYPILGNHDLYALVHLSGITIQENEEGNLEIYANDPEGFRLWLEDGGESTLRNYLEHSEEERKDFLDYLKSLPLYREIEINGKRFTLVHGSLGNFKEERELSDYSIEELLLTRFDFNKTYYKDPNHFLICGHTPTPALTGEDRILRQDNLIDIDCGCVYGGRLASLCLDTFDEMYVKKQDP